MTKSDDKLRYILQLWSSQVSRTKEMHLKFFRKSVWKIQGEPRVFRPCWRPKKLGSDVSSNHHSGNNWVDELLNMLKFFFPTSLYLGGCWKMWPILKMCRLPTLINIIRKVRVACPEVCLIVNSRSNQGAALQSVSNKGFFFSPWLSEKVSLRLFVTKVGKQDKKCPVGKTVT